MRAKDIFAAGGARDGGFGAFARCPGQGWDGPGRKAGVFVILCQVSPRFLFILTNKKHLPHILNKSYKVVNNVLVLPDYR
jgi:hypothetical protein